MIKAIITDVDGVLTGTAIGFNFPKSHPDVIAALITIHKKGIPIVLCTAKIASAITDIIIDAKLANPHISDGGALIFDPLNSKIVKEYVLDNTLVRKIINLCVAHNLHVSAHTVDNVFIDKTHRLEITEKRKVILKRDLDVVNSLEEHVTKHEIIKLTLTVVDKQEAALVDKLLAPFKEKIHFIWSHNPMSDPWEYGVISSKGVSKASASKYVADILKVDMKDILGIGDGLADWVFIKECGYAGVVGKKSKELLDLATTKGEGKYFLAPSVDENGVLNVFRYFNLI